MAEKNKKSVLNGRFSLNELFYRNTFILVFSFIVALVVWFVMAMQNAERNITVQDVPITVQLSEAAAADGVQVFNMSYSSADLELSGNKLVTGKLTADDFQVTALLNPISTKLTGNTLQKATIGVQALKRNSVAEYSIVSVSPEEITVEYDRYKEASFSIEQDLKYSADTGYYPGTPVLSAESVTVRGPESSVNKISRAALSYSVNNPLRAETTFTCPVRLYDQDNKELTDIVGLYLELDVDTVTVTVPILSRKTVNIVPTILHQPKGFSDSRITVEPSQIDIVGSADTLSTISEITLDTPIDFYNLDVSQKNSFTMEIPLPAGVRNVGTTGENSVTQATVSINLNDYKRVVVSVPVTNFQVSNQPADREVSFSTQLLDVTVMGSDAQTSKLTGESLAVAVDLANFADRFGTVQVPVTISFTGSGSDSCWVYGTYTVTLQLKTPSASAAPGTGDAENVASPNE